MKKKIILIIAIIFVAAVSAGIYLTNRLFHMIFVSQMDSIVISNTDNNNDDYNNADNKTKPDKEPSLSIEIPPEFVGGIKHKPEPAKQGPDKASNKNNNNSVSPNTSAQANNEPINKHQTEDTPKKTVTLTQDKISEMEKQVSVADKARVMAIVTSRLSPVDVAAMKGLLEGGLTDAKIGMAKQLLKNKVTGKEKEELKQIFYKYVLMLGR